MMKGLAALLVRKTQESRLNAEAAVEHWRRVVDAAEHVAKKAEYEFSLPSALKPVSGLAQAIATANHVVAVGIAARAVSARHEVMKIATKGLERELRSRKEAAKAAHRELEGLKSVYEAEMREANSLKTKAEIPNAFYTPPVLPRAPRFGESAVLGLGLSILLYIVLTIVGLILVAVVGRDIKFDKTPLGITASIIVGIATLGLMFGWLIAPLWASLSHDNECYLLEAEAKSKAKIEASVSLAQAEKRFAEVEKEYRVHLPTCERAVEQADQRVQNAESSLQWLRSHG